MTQLVVVRGVQGLAAGGLMPLAMTAVGDLVEPRERGRYQGYISMVFAGATVLGPLIGGLLTDHVSWRVPLCGECGPARGSCGLFFYATGPRGVAARVALSAPLPLGAPTRPAHKLD